MGISVIMPTYNQASYISCAIKSLQNQTFADWELIIINDGCTDNTKVLIQDFLSDNRIRYFENATNQGLGVAINCGLRNARYDYIAYLPSDDLYFSNHLQVLYNTLMTSDYAILVYSGLRYGYTITMNCDTSPSSKTTIPGRTIQLVQVLHKNTGLEWMERNELVTDNLFKMYWVKLIGLGAFLPTNIISCEWTNHPFQRHKIILDKIGTPHKYRSYYNVDIPIKFCATGFSFIDEPKLYQSFRKKPLPISKKGLRILLVGELSFNPERIFALEEAGHELFGLWANDPIYGMVGPLPFGNVKTIPYNNWEDEIKKVKPDIVYALLNHMAVPLAHEVLLKKSGIPFVWHFKESPHHCRQNGTWDKLCDLFRFSDGQIYTSMVMKDWFGQYLAPEQRFTLILDGDLPKKDCFLGEQTELLSDNDGEIHTVLPGRPVGIKPEDVAILAKQKIHFHLYGESFQNMWRSWVVETAKVAEGYFHLHPNCSQENWVKEFSRYDGGWLHSFKSENDSDLMRVNWNDMNIPARLTTLALSGVPLLQKNNGSHIVETQKISESKDIGILFNDYEQLYEIFQNKIRMKQLRDNIWDQRLDFTFDNHVPELIDFFIQVIKAKTGLK